MSAPVSTRSAPLLTVGIGDIHGRFHRVREWVQALEQGLGRPVDAILAVGDVEAFRRADDHRRKAAKRQMPAEFADYASGERTLGRPLYFIGGNNEDFESLHPLQAGGELIPGVRYLGRAGVTRLGELHIAYLSGIYAPRHYQLPLKEPSTRETQKQAGYYREPEVAALQPVEDVDLMLVHEWPRGLVVRRRGGPVLRAHRFPWIGSPVTRALVERVQPRWLLCGHSHVPLATTLVHPSGTATRVACLDQAARPDGAVFWIEWEGRAPVRAGWGVSGQAAWRADEVWDEARTPQTDDLSRDGAAETAM